MAFVFYTIITYYILRYVDIHIRHKYLNRVGEWVSAKFLASLEKALERSPERLLTGPHRGARGVKGMPAQVVVHHPKSLEGVPGRHLERSVCRCDLVLVEVGGAVGVNVDDCVGRRHDCYCLLYFITDTLFLCLILSI
jgi:hypothetical protein